MSEFEELEAKCHVQLRKGTLELVVLAALQGRTMYGLELLNMLHKFETTKITEGTLYPLLDRLKKDGSVEAKWVQEGDTRPRKYYSLAPAGVTKLNILADYWRKSVPDIEFLLTHSGANTDNLEE